MEVHLRTPQDPRNASDVMFLIRLAGVVGLLFAVMLSFIALARGVQARTQTPSILEDAAYHASVEANIADPARVAVAGADNTGLEIVAAAGSPASPTGSALAVTIPENGEAAYRVACSACHDAGIAGAPKLGDASAWSARVGQGRPTLYKHAIEGYQGQAGVMPAKGGRTDWPDEIVQAAVDFMLDPVS